MKISLDFDGVIVAHTQFCAQLVVALQLAGHKVGILAQYEPAEASNMHIWLINANFPDLDFFICSKPETTDDYLLWKAKTTKLNNIDYHFDGIRQDTANCSAEKLLPVVLTVQKPL